MSRTFDYVKYDAVSIEKQEAFKKQFEQIESMAVLLLPDGRSRASLLTNLEVAYMWVGKAIRDEQIKRGAQTEHTPERG
jgi:hypothetical protein